MIVPLLLGLTLTSPDVKTGAPVARAFVWNKDGCNGENRTPRLRVGRAAGRNALFRSDR